MMHIDREMGILSSSTSDKTFDFAKLQLYEKDI